MSKRVVIVHGWDGYPEEGWFPYLRKKLEAKGFEVLVPQLPDAENPRIEKWVPALRAAVGTPDEDTYFVGHSMGCQTIVRYLESLSEGVRVGGAVFVAGFFKRLSGLGDVLDVQETARLWLGVPVDLKKAAAHLKNGSVAIFSDNDPFVPLDNQDDFHDLLGSRIIVVPDGGHFSGALNRCFELPVALRALLEIAKEE